MHPSPVAPRQTVFDLLSLIPIVHCFGAHFPFSSSNPAKHTPVSISTEYKFIFRTVPFAKGVEWCSCRLQVSPTPTPHDTFATALQPPHAERKISPLDLVAGPIVVCRKTPPPVALECTSRKLMSPLSRCPVSSVYVTQNLMVWSRISIVP